MTDQQGRGEEEEARSELWVERLCGSLKIRLNSLSFRQQEMRSQ